jgi:hypothetical protein
MAEIRLGQNTIRSDSLTEIDPGKFSTLKVNPAHVRTGKIRLPEGSTWEPESREIRATEIHAVQTSQLIGPPRQASAENPKARLHIRSAIAEPGEFSVNCRGRVRLTEAPWGMNAYERFQELCDRLLVSLRVPRDPLQRQDAANPHVKHSAPNLVDGSGKSLCDLSLAANEDLLPGGDHTSDKKKTTQCLQQGSPGVVLQRALGLLEFNALLCTRHAPQLDRCQRGVEQPWKKQHTEQKQAQPCEDQKMDRLVDRCIIVPSSKPSVGPRQARRRISWRGCRFRLAIGSHARAALCDAMGGRLADPCRTSCR